MRKWFLILMMAALLATPSLALAQTDATLAEVRVQLWPEYDQPSMLVIVDYAVTTDTALPVNLKFRIPADANLIAVANYAEDGGLLNAEYENPKAEGEWQVFTITLDFASGHFEYYQPIAFNGEQRAFSYLWDQGYAVDAFSIRVLEPLDAAELTTNPKLKSVANEQGLKYYGGAPFKVAANEQFVMTLEYKKTSDALVTTSPEVQPAAPLDDTTQGRVSFNNILPYILGGIGILLVVGGGVYLLQADKQTEAKKNRRRLRAKSDEAGGDVYCPQCGTRARGGDRFCRTCGSRLRINED